MFENLPKYSSLLIVSDTPMWQTNEGVTVFEPTLREVEWLAEIFERITWMGYGHKNAPKGFARLTTKSNIDFVVLPFAVGGGAFIQKFRIIPFVPMMVIAIQKQVRKNEFIHTRGPAVPALIAILISYFDHSRKYWHKYAGNWRQSPAPWAYALQRFLLRHNPHKVSINGTWPGEPSNIINLENPCLTNDELIVANAMGMQKSNSEATNICFVGGLTRAKGIHQFIESLATVKQHQKVGDVYIAGDGSERTVLEERASSLSINVRFLGNLKRAEINKVYGNSHIIILPSATEGFPKVIAEAAAFGCVPIVTDVSSIGQYIVNERNGLLLADTRPDSIARALDFLLANPDKMKGMRSEAIELSARFTYERYCLRVVEIIFKKSNPDHRSLQEGLLS